MPVRSSEEATPADRDDLLVADDGGSFGAGVGPDLDVVHLGGGEADIGGCQHVVGLAPSRDEFGGRGGPGLDADRVEVLLSSIVAEEQQEDERDHLPCAARDT